MLRGTKVALRTRHADDIPILHTELFEDVAMRSRADGRAWRPMPESASTFVVTPPLDDAAPFSVVELATGELAGDAILWGIDQHNRMAHLGMALRPSYRGRGLGVDTVRVLCHYGFSVLGMQRLQVETLADNAAMIAAATRAGFVQEGVLRRAAWVTGQFCDEVVLGQLAGEWTDA